MLIHKIMSKKTSLVSLGDDAKKKNKQKILLYLTVMTYVQEIVLGRTGMCTFGEESNKINS